MSQDTTHQQTDLDEIQAQDDAGLEAAIEGVIQNQREEQARRQDLQIEGFVRALIKEARTELGNGNDQRASYLLGGIRQILHNDGDVDLVYSKQGRFLEESLDISTDEAVSLRAQLRRHGRIRTRTHRSPPPEQELKTLAAVAKALGYFSSARDMTRYAPVRFADLNEPGARNEETPQTIGRRRIRVDSGADLQQRAVEIPHKSADHVLAVALPRRGKDSTIASFGKSLKEDFGYSYVSLMDDGRMETPMVSIPNDEDVIRRNLDRLNQEPDAMDATVWLPAVDGVPDRLPGNFKLFTIGIDDLTPHLILRLSGARKGDETVEARIQRALQETLNGSGQVDELVSRLRVYAKEMEATIEWTEREDGETETRTAHYQMDAEKALDKSAQRLAQLAGEGLITSTSADTNIDMPAVLGNNEEAAILCCNFLPDGLEGLKYTIQDLWLRLIYQAKDSDQYRLPRVCIEIRELKNIAPTNTAMPDRNREAIKALRQTIFFLSTQGGSRRIMILGSTQKLNDVQKAIRSNMATKILLQLGEEEIETLDKSYHFSNEQKQQLKEFNIGQGMIIAQGEAYWPIELRGAPCGLGDGDRNWLDRFGLAWGARVREWEYEGWTGEEDGPEWWVNANTGAVSVVATAGKPPVGEWYLLPEDLPADAHPDLDAEEEPEPIAWEVLAEALEQRREYDVGGRLRMESTEFAGKQRTLSLSADGPAAKVEDIIENHNIPTAIHSWLDKQPSAIRKLVDICRAIDENGPYQTQTEIAEDTDWPRSTLANYLGENGPLDPCYEEYYGEYHIEPVGEEVASLDWEGILNALERSR